MYTRYMHPFADVLHGRTILPAHHNNTMAYVALGKYDKQKAGHDEHYYAERHCMIDYRGILQISPLSYFGFGVTVITASHSIFLTGQFNPAIVMKRVIVDEYAWITSKSILYNCHVEHHGVVSIGAVVTNMIVESYTVVAGNPAFVIARWNGERWLRTDSENPLPFLDV